ncbi:MAG: P-type conjugative transfer protein TrbL, partial [Pannonibacter sp.]
ATGGTGAEPGPETPGPRPAWARALSARQRLGQAGALAAHTLRDGDRAMPGAAPDLKQTED